MQQNEPHHSLKQKLKKANSTVYLGPHRVGQGFPTFFIAEIGNNHNGDFYLAKRSIEVAAQAGAHAVKFQKRFIDDVFAKELREKPQTKEEVRGKTYGEYRAGMELSKDEFLKLREIARVHNVEFFATPFDIPSVDFLEEIEIPFYKISSFDVTNIPLLEYVAKKDKPIILSTGTATIEEVDEAVETILKYNANLVVLHCVSVYPSPDEEVNLKVMESLMDRYDNRIPIGYSGHEQDILPTLAAVTLGARVVERHFTLSNYMPGPDHGSVSIDPSAFAEVVASARRIHTIYGSWEKKLLESEYQVRNKHTKSVVAKTTIPKGTVITVSMLTCKSPGYGLKPNMLSKLIGKKAALDIEEDCVIKQTDIIWEDEVGIVSPMNAPLKTHARQKNGKDKRKK